MRVSGMRRWICSIRNWSGCKTYGPSALLTASGWQSTGMFHNASGMLARAIALHGNSVSTGGLFDRRGAGDSAARGGFNGSVRAANVMASGFTEQ
ncbi:hypothetical protein JS565_23345 [Salmonella enterica subsp. enterica serovar Senftenberg]|nr:hypothetical protein [Salmonella enterica subsp. enterica serovar Senftenberg]